MAPNNQDGDTLVLPTKRIRRASFRLADSDNDADIKLSSHREARAAAASSSHTPLPPRHAGTVSTRNSSVSCEEVDDDDEGSETGYSATEGGAKRRKVRKRKSKGKGRASSHTTTPAASPAPSGTQDAATPSAPSPTPTVPTPAQAQPAQNDSGSKSDNVPAELHSQKRTIDVKHFFTPPTCHGPIGSKKMFRQCLLCEKKQIDFTSMLPADAKAHKEAANSTKVQSALDSHVEVVDPETIICYSDTKFQEAAEDWLISTDQPLDTLSHPKFQYMIDIVSCATNGVKIPEKRVTRVNIIARFEKNVQDVRKRLNSNAVKGQVSLTTDAWQALNRNSYLAVTGHWVEEVGKGD